MPLSVAGLAVLLLWPPSPAPVATPPTSPAFAFPDVPVPSTTSDAPVQGSGSAETAGPLAPDTDTRGSLPTSDAGPAPDPGSALGARSALGGGSALGAGSTPAAGTAGRSSPCPHAGAFGPAASEGAAGVLAPPPVVLADVDGDGCPEAVRVTGTVIEAGPHRWRVGRSGDQVAVGDWWCSGLASAAVLRPGTGTIWAYGGWSLPGQPLAHVSRLAIPGATTITASDPEGDNCHELRVQTAEGPEILVLPEPEAALLPSALLPSARPAGARPADVGPQGSGPQGSGPQAPGTRAEAVRP
ncbi:MAG: hypothetical protein ACT4OS_10625 [Acidimicrobiales bacterium]